VFFLFSGFPGFPGPVYTPTTLDFDVFQRFSVDFRQNRSPVMGLLILGSSTGVKTPAASQKPIWILGTSRSDKT